MRYFLTRLQDFIPGTRVQIDSDFWKGHIQFLVETICKKMPPNIKNCDGGLYVGCPGVAYMFYYLAHSETFNDVRADYLKRGHQYITQSLEYVNSSHNRDPPAAFLLGNAGVHAVASIIFKSLGETKLSDEQITKYSVLSSVCLPIDYLPKGSDELFVGRAGYLCGTLLLNRIFGKVLSQEAVHGICLSIVQSGRKYAQRHNSRSPLMYAYYDTEYLGPAHGLSAILQMLLCFPDFLTSDPEIERDVHRAVDFMLGILKPNGNMVPAMDELHSQRPESEELVHWCHGGPGVIYLFARAYLLWKDAKYLEACQRCGEITWQKGLLRKGPGICHGVAGSGYVFLLLYRLTSDERHLHRAVKFAEFLLTDEFQKGARTPDTPYSLYEGWAGTVCFLVDLLQPQKSEFPFFNVFV